MLEIYSIQNTLHYYALKQGVLYIWNPRSKTLGDSQPYYRLAGNTIQVGDTPATLKETILLQDWENYQKNKIN